MLLLGSLSFSPVVFNVCVCVYSGVRVQLSVPAARPGDQRGFRQAAGLHAAQIQAD